MRMIRINCSVSLATFLWMMILVRADTDVSCVVEENCMLPCSFQEGPEVVIRWTKLTEGLPHVHSFSNNQDQLGDQDQNFRGRTSLSKDQISRGDASLQLTGVKVQDQGQYQCYTRTTSGVNKSIINLNVDDNSVAFTSIKFVIIVAAGIGIFLFPSLCVYICKCLIHMQRRCKPKTVRYSRGTSETSSPPNGENQQQVNNSHLLDPHEE